MIRRLNRLVRVADINGTHTVSLWRPAAPASGVTTGALLSEEQLLLDLWATFSVNSQHTCSRSAAGRLVKQEQSASHDPELAVKPRKTISQVTSWKENFSSSSCFCQKCKRYLLNIPATEANFSLVDRHCVMKRPSTRQYTCGKGFINI